MEIRQAGDRGPNFGWPSELEVNTDDRFVKFVETDGTQLLEPSFDSSYFKYRPEMSNDEHQVLEYTLSYKLNFRLQAEVVDGGGDPDNVTKLTISDPEPGWVRRWTRRALERLRRAASAKEHEE